MKIRYFMATALLAAFSAFADTNNENPMYMVVSLTNGSLKVVNVDAVDKITFDSSVFKATDKKGATVVETSLPSLYAIEFNESGTTGVETVTSEDINLVYEPQSDILRVGKGNGCKFYVYDLSGRLILTAPLTNDNIALDLSQLLKGNYIVKVSDVTLKISRK